MTSYEILARERDAIKDTRKICVGERSLLYKIPSRMKMSFLRSKDLKFFCDPQQ